MVPTLVLRLMNCAPINVSAGTGAAGWLMVGLLLASGCGESPQISRYSVAKPADTPSADRDDVGSFETRPGSAWFLKLTGPADAVAQVEPAFQQLVESITLADGEPSWTLPEGWSEQSGTGMRFATLTADQTDPPLEASVIKLPYLGDRDSYLQENINRWRGQLGLPAAIDADWLARAITAGEVHSLAGAAQDTTLVDLTGKTEEFPQARMLAAILLPESTSARSSPPMSLAVPESPSPPMASASPLRFDAPDEWEPGKTVMMRVAAFQVSDGDQSAEITVIPAGGNLLDNVNRWRGQVGLDRWTDEQLQEHSEALTVDGQTATFVDLAGTEQTILAAVLPGEPQSWFFKLMGDPDLARRETDRFKAFVESVTFK